MRTSILTSLVILTLFAFLYFSNQIEKELYKDEFAHAKCREAIILDIPRAFLHPDTYQTAVFYSSKTKTIDFNQTQITGLPDNFFENSDCIERLIIDNNLLRTIPKTIQELQNLQDINLSQNIIHNIPKSFFSSFDNLSDIDLSKNNLRIANLKNANLTSIALNNNHLEKLIVNDSTFINTLNLSDNEFFIFPKEILNIKNLYTLDLHSNYVKNFSNLKNNSLVTQSSLETLILNYNPIKKFPTDLRYFPNLSSIDFYSCNLQGTVEIDGFPSLSLLEITSQKITRLILKENNLSTIRLNNNRIREVIIEGSEAGQQVVTLNLSNNPLKEIPNAFKNLLNLSELDLKNTRLTAINDFDKFPFKKTLTQLDLSFNQLKILPNLPNYTELRSINLSHNQLTDLPVLNTAKLKKLDLSNNLITYPDISKLDISVEELILSNNNIKEIKGNQVKENLKILDLSYNRNLENLTVGQLRLFPKLERVNLYETNLEDKLQGLIQTYCNINDIIVNFDDKEF